MRRHYRHDPEMFARMDRLLGDITETFGTPTRLAAPVIGRWIHGRLKKEEARLAAGWRYEPGCFYEKNAAAQALKKAPGAQPRPAAAVEGFPVALPLAK
jgi:hypothetical protein